MRPSWLSCALVVLILPTCLRAQEEKPKFLVKIDQVRVGFRAYANDASGQFKVGMWTPVYVDITAGPKGVPLKDPPAFLEFESTDSEGVGTFYRIHPVSLEPNEVRTFIGFTKPGNYETAGRVGVKLHWDEKTFEPRTQQLGAPLFELGAHLYLSLGSRIPDMREALLSLAQVPNMPPPDFNNRDTAPRYAAFETDPQRLPELWFGYQGVDLMILSTDSKFLTELLREANRPRLKAIAQWVRRGGRLVIPVNHLTQDLLKPLLEAPVWQPPIPVVPPAHPGDVKQAALKRLEAVEHWAGTNAKPFPGPGENAVPIAKLDPGQVPGGVWDIHAKSDDGRPLIARLPYGRGSITYVAFTLTDPPFTRWDGRVDFLKTVVKEFAPHVSDTDHNQNLGGRGGREDESSSDITTSLQRSLDNFDVNIVPFGYVALFIILYILVVGPLDYFVLKHVFHKLEWTWITFPVVVLAVSIAAYFTAYALKGNDLKINKVDIVDFDLRTDLDGKQGTARAFAYGQTFFTILSPRIQNYTVGVEPNPAFWGAKAENPLTADQVSWLGRPEFDGPGAMGRSGSQGFFRRPYSYAEDAKGIIGVPIPVWTTKCFNASWEAPLPKVPFQCDLVYHTREFQGKNFKLTGTIKNNLPVDLEDVWIFFGDRCYPLAGGLPGSGTGGEPSKIALLLQDQKDILGWVSSSEERPLAPRNKDFRNVQGMYNPTPLIRQAMFFEKKDQNNSARNHSLRFLDFSWRLQSDPGPGETRLREAILYAHVPFQRGQADAITKGPIPLPTNLWLGQLPFPYVDLSGAKKDTKTQPALAGTLAQDTFIRVLVPVRPSDNRPREGLP
jgi:hypothetical protein